MEQARHGFTEAFNVLEAELAGPGCKSKTQEKLLSYIQFLKMFSKR